MLLPFSMPIFFLNFSITSLRVALLDMMYYTTLLTNLIVSAILSPWNSPHSKSSLVTIVVILQKNINFTDEVII